MSSSLADTPTSNGGVSIWIYVGLTIAAVVLLLVLVTTIICVVPLKQMDACCYGGTYWK